MAILTREDILKVQDLKCKTINVPEWGGEVIVKEMSAARRLEFERLLTENEDQVRILLVAICVVNEAGEPLFTVEDVQSLGKKNFQTVRKVSNVAIRLNEVKAEQENGEA